MVISLDKLKNGCTATVLSIKTNASLKQRLMDIGFVKGATVKAVHQSPSGNPRAYLIKGVVIALRNCDASEIVVEVESDE